MTEQANAPRAWMRWAIALALISGSVVGSVAPAFAQDNGQGSDPVVEQSTADTAPAADAPVEQAPADEAPVVEEAPAVEQAPAVEEAPVVADAPVQEVAAEPVADQSTGGDQGQADNGGNGGGNDGGAAGAQSEPETPFFDPVAPAVTNNNPIMDSQAAQDALGQTEDVSQPETQQEQADVPADNQSDGNNGDGGSQEPAATDDSGAADQPVEEPAQPQFGDDNYNIFDDPNFNPDAAADAPVVDQSDSSGNADSGSTDNGNGNDDKKNNDNGQDAGGSSNNGGQADASDSSSNNDTGAPASNDDTTTSNESTSAAPDTSVSQSASNDDDKATTDASDENSDNKDQADQADSKNSDSESDTTVNQQDADIDGDGNVSVVEQQKAERKSAKKESRGKSGNNNNNNNNNHNGGGNNNNNNGKNNNNNNHHMGLAASRVAGLNRGGAGNTASAGNGGRANASADGGIVVIGAINSGGNKGNTVNVGTIGGYDCNGAPIYIDGGNVDNSTNLNIDASGGTAIADASGGSDNLAMTSGNGKDDKVRAPIRSMYGLGGGRGNNGGGGNVASAGNGGQANSSADGGIVVIDEINSGGNEGNTINVEGVCGGAAAPVYVPDAPANPGKPGKEKPGKTVVVPVTPARATGGAKVKVIRVPSTGVGHIPAPVQSSPFYAPVATMPEREDEEELGEEQD